LPENAVLVPVTEIGKAKRHPVFLPKDAPVFTAFNIHVDGEYQKYPGTKKLVRVFRNSDGEFIFNDWARFKQLEPNFPFPENAELIPFTEIGKFYIRDFEFYIRERESTI
jgi:hypothetical protein